jgi:two-component system, NarL family, response regulator NreC
MAQYVKEKGLPLPVTILLAHRSPLVREGLKTVLGSQEDLRVIGETNNGLDALTLVDRLRPDVLIVDVRMPRLSGLEVTRQVCQRVPRTRVMVLSASTNVTYVLEARHHGATGYLLKDDDISELAEKVRDVAAGRLTLSTALAERLIALQSHRTPPGVRDLYETLTTREREVLHLAAEGWSSTEIAVALGISPRTVETHRSHLMQKLGLRTQTELIRYALSRGILPLEM